MYFFTFPNRYQVLRNRYVSVDTEDYDEARAKIFNSIVGQRFAFQYNETDFEGQPQKYGLHEISLSNIKKSHFDKGPGESNDSN